MWEDRSYTYRQRSPPVVLATLLSLHDLFLYESVIASDHYLLYVLRAQPLKPDAWTLKSLAHGIHKIISVLPYSDRF